MISENKRAKKKELDLQFKYVGRCPQLISYTWLVDVNMTGCSITTLEGKIFPEGLKRLKLKNNMISSMEKCELPESLLQLYMGFNRLEKFDGSKYKNIKVLELTGNILTEVILPKNVVTCMLANNKLTHITTETTPDLMSINLATNEFEELELVGENLITVNVSYNKLTKMPKLPNTVGRLLMSVNKIEKIEKELPTNLKYFVASKCGITEISIKFPPEMDTLNLSENKLTMIKLPDKVEELDLSHNEIESGHEVILPADISILKLNNNKLAYMPNLPEGVVEIDLSNNELEELGEVPWSVEILCCMNNNIKALPHKLLERTTLHIEYDGNLIEIESEEDIENLSDLWNIDSDDGTYSRYSSEYNLLPSRTYYHNKAAYSDPYASYPYYNHQTYNRYKPYNYTPYISTHATKKNSKCVSVTFKRHVTI